MRESPSDKFVEEELQKLRSQGVMNFKRKPQKDQDSESAKILSPNLAF